MSKELIEQLAIPQDIVDDLKTVGLYLTETDHVLSAIVELIILRDQRKAYAQTQGQSIPDRKILSEIAYEAHKRSIGNDCEPRFSINISGIEYLISEVMPAAPIESGVKGKAETYEDCISAEYIAREYSDFDNKRK